MCRTAGTFFLARAIAHDRLASQGRGGNNDLHDPRFQRRIPDADSTAETASGGFKSSQPEKCRLGPRDHALALLFQQIAHLKNRSQNVSQRVHQCIDASHVIPGRLGNKDER
jgi:hypothetical protein